MHRHRSLLAAVSLAALVAGVLPGRGFAQDYPRLGLYGSMFGDGYPLWDATGTLNPTVLDELARYHEVILDASPITPYRPDAALALRLRRPDIKLLAYVPGHLIWPAAQPDSEVHFPTRFRRIVRDHDAFLYNTFGEEFGSRHTACVNVNLAKRSGGRFVVAEALADLFRDAIISSGIWDGVFVDVFCEDILWMETPAESIDIVRAGYPDRVAFAAAWKAATDTMAVRMRRAAGPTQILIGNCGQGTKYPVFNGWMREGFPFQNGGTWQSNMFRDVGGYLADESRWVQPAHNYNSTASIEDQSPYSGENMRKVRYGLASGALGSGYGVFNPGGRFSRPDQYMAWWYDEYAVNLATGASSTLQQHTGWLGQPLGPYYQMVWVGPGPDAAADPGFESGLTTGWTFHSTSGAIATRDTTESMEGDASFHLSNPPTGAGLLWTSALRTQGTIAVFTNVQYAATFWVRASKPTTFSISIGPAGGGPQYGGDQWVTADTTWRRIQVMIVPSVTGNGALTFIFNNTPGELWLDDAHLQQGASMVYRRDFQNGTVLVNPSNYPLDVVMERPFRRILGTMNMAVNDGSESGVQRLNSNDALFLIGSDHTPPVGVRDLHPVPPGTPGTRGASPRDPR